MSSQNDNIANVNLQGLLQYLPQNFTYLDAIKEVVDNSKDSNAKYIKVILLQEYLAICDNGDGMDEAVRKSKFLDFFAKTFDPSKIGSKGVGAKAATAKLSNNQNMYYFTKTNKDDWPYQINVFHGDAIKNNSLSSYSQSEIQSSKDKELMSLKDLVYKENEIKTHAFDYLGLDKGTVCYLNNKDSCKRVLESLDEEAKVQKSAVYDYVTNDLSNTYSNFLREGLKIELICPNKKTLIEPSTMFNLCHYKLYEVRYLEEKKECYVKFNEEWKRVLYSIKSTQFEKAKDEDINNPKLLKFNLYHWYEHDLNVYAEFTGYNKTIKALDKDFEKLNEKEKNRYLSERKKEINNMHDKVAGVYGCRNNKFTKRYWTMPSKKFNSGDGNIRPVYRGSVFIVNHDNTCDTIFETGINKSVLGTKKEGNYFTNSIDCIFNKIVMLKISELKKKGIIEEYEYEKNKKKKIEDEETDEETEEEYEDAKEYSKSKEPLNKVQKKKFELSDKEEKVVVPNITVKEKKVEPLVTVKEKVVVPPVINKKEEKVVVPLVTDKKEEKKVDPPVTTVKEKVVVPFIKEKETHKIVTQKLKPETLMCILKQLKKPENVDDNDWKKFEEEIQELITCKV